MSNFRPFQLLCALINSVGGTGSTKFSPAISTWKKADIRQQGGEIAAQHGCCNFAAQARPFWRAIDVDTLDPSCFPHLANNLAALQIKSLEGKAS